MLPDVEWNLGSRSMVASPLAARPAFAKRGAPVACPPKTSAAFFRGMMLAASLTGGAILMSLALTSPKFWWLGWFTLVPLFLAIRLLSPAKASICGAFWGLAFYATSVAMADARVPHTWVSLLLLVAAPGLYSLVAAEVTRRKGFHPFLLGLGWAGVELLLTPLSLQHGLLATTQGNSLFVHAVGNLGGYILVAFLLALANAWLLSLLSSVRLPVAQQRPLVIPVRLDALLPLVERVYSSSRFLSPAQPRAPPALQPA